MAIGWVNTYLHQPENIDILFGKDGEYIATVLSDNESETMQHLIVEISNINIDNNQLDIKPFKCKVSTPSSFPDFQPGDIIKFSSKLNDISQDINAIYQTDYNSQLKRQGIIASTFVEVENISFIEKDNSFIWKIRRLRPHLSKTIFYSSLNENTAEFVNTILTGDGTYLAPETRLNYNGSGLAHILALSGLHIGVLMVIISIILFPLYIYRKNKSRYIITIILLWGYAILTGLSPSVTRAVIMATVFMIGMIIQRRHNPMNALCFAALLILFFNPYNLYSISFQLSFVAVASILIFTQKINPINRKSHPFIYYISTIATVSISATIGTCMIVVYYFHTFPTYFLIGNIAVTLLLPLLMFGSIILILFQLIGFTPMFLCRSIDYIYNCIENIASGITSLPLSTIDNIYISEWLLIPISITLISFALLVYLRRKVYLISTCLFLAFSISVHYISKPEYIDIEYFIPKQSYHTDIMIKEHDNIFISTTADSTEHDNIIKSYKTLYRDYLAQRNIDNISIIPNNYSGNNIMRHGHYMLIGNDMFYIANDNDMPPKSPIDIKYLLICRGFKGKIADIYDKINADTILLSNDLHIKRHNKHIKYCIENNLPYRSLKDSPHHRIISR